MRIAIDGPAGAGKSTVAKKAAQELGYVYIDTGAMYRALTYKAIQKNLEIDNGQELASFLLKNPVKLLVVEDRQIVMIDEQDVTEEIRTSNVSKNVSKVAAHEPVRKVMLTLQRELADKGNIIMDGRDIGTNILPNADIKIYLTATIDERANRRYQELLKTGYNGTLEEIKKDISSRDKQDEEREFAPLKKAEDAILLDTSNLSIDQVVQSILNLVNEKQKGER